MRDVDEVTAAVVDQAFRLHRRIGPGLLESVYERVLARILEQRGFSVERQKSVTFEIDGMVFEEGFRVDLLDLRVGLLINFGAPFFKDGVRRVVDRHSPTSASPLRIRR